MGRIVAGLGLPHSPGYPALVAREGPTSETAQLYQEVATRLDAAQPDLLVVFDSDHLNTFSLTPPPTLCIGVTNRTSGPNDGTPNVPQYDVPVAEDAAATLLQQGLVAGFDFDSIVAVLASGDFSNDVGGMLAPRDEFAGSPDLEWAQHVVDLMRACKIDDLVREATTPRMARAGNVAGELLNWIALLGAIGECRPDFLEPQVEEGHAYDFWSVA